MILWAKKYLAGQFCRNCVSIWLKVIQSQNEILVSSKLPKIWLTFWEIWAKIHSEINWPLSWLPLNWNNFWRSILFFFIHCRFHEILLLFSYERFLKVHENEILIQKEFQLTWRTLLFFLDLTRTFDSGIFIFYSHQ